MNELTEFIAGLPKAELHVHHVGSASPRIVAELAARHAGSTPVPADPARLADYFTFTDFAHFIEVYLSVVDLIRDAEDVWTLTYEVARDLAAQQVRYAELTLTPYSSIVRGIPPRRSARRSRTPAARAERDFGIDAALVLRHPRRGRRRRPPTLTLEVAARAAAGRAGQLRARRARDRRAARRSSSRTSTGPRAAGLHSVPHAGESTGPETVWDALDHLGAERIGHGIAAAQRPAAAASTWRATRSRSRCARPPTSAPGRWPSLAEHPLPALVAAGVPVTINSDDPPMFAHHAEPRVRGRRRAARARRGRGRRAGPGGRPGVVPRRAPASTPCSPRSTTT